jgi:exopolysaccharide biosynthesis predicted pyruvyltransferase EpsI
MQTTNSNPKTTDSSANDIWGGRQLILDLQAKARKVLDPLIPADSSIALLDYPNNSNVGDSLIWLGETAYLRSRHLSPSYVCDCRNYDPIRIERILQNNPVILLNGGGYFGSLWPELHAFRLKVLRDFPGVPVIQFAQSIHFEDNFILDETAKAIRAHGKYTLLVRDQPSFDFAKKHFDCNVQLCPDMAFFIGGISSEVPPQFDRFILSRTDSEKSSNWIDALVDLDHKATVNVSDWLDMGWHERISGRIERYTVGLRKLVDKDNRLLLLLWNSLSNARLKRGQALLQRGKVVIADRLHVHILSILLNKPHVLLDNSYRKLGNLHDAWTTPYRGVQFVKNLTEAFQVAQTLDLKKQHSESENLLQSKA